MKSKHTTKSQRIAIISGELVAFAVRVAVKNNRRQYEQPLCSN